MLWESSHCTAAERLRQTLTHNIVASDVTTTTCVLTDDYDMSAQPDTGTVRTGLCQVVRLSGVSLDKYRNYINPDTLLLAVGESPAPDRSSFPDVASTPLLLYSSTPLLLYTPVPR